MFYMGSNAVEANKKTIITAGYDGGRIKAPPYALQQGREGGRFDVRLQNCIKTRNGQSESVQNANTCDGCDLIGTNTHKNACTSANVREFVRDFANACECLQVFANMRILANVGKRVQMPECLRMPEPLQMSANVRALANMRISMQLRGARIAEAITATATAAAYI